VAAGRDRAQDLVGDDAAEVGVAELVDELHSRTSATPAWTRRRSEGATGSTRAISTVLLAPSSSAHRASPRSSSIFRTDIGTPSSPHVMQ
jgi:hypothetical protein